LKSKIETEYNDQGSAWCVFLVFLKLGLTSFGGPIAHLGYFRDEFVVRRKWLDEAAYAELVAFCQFLPGPASSQVGMTLGLMRAGMPGMLSAWLGFTLPSAILLALFALSVTSWGLVIPSGAVHGLKIVAVAVVAQAVWGMARTLCATVQRAMVAVVAAGTALAMSGPWSQVGIIAISALIGVLWFAPVRHSANAIFDGRITPQMGRFLLSLFAILLIGLPLVAQAIPGPLTAIVAAFYQAGALVFGGGHVVLPLLDSSVVSTGWVNNDLFLTGYGAAQAVPGPLFTFAAFLGAVIDTDHAVLAASAGLLAIFLPAFLLVLGALPLWSRLRTSARAGSALAAVNAAVVGLLAAALYQPMWISTVHDWRDLAFVSVTLAVLIIWRLPPWIVVITCALAGWILM